jgi:hypothetical protein
MARRVILGKIGADYRFRVSQPGLDAATAGLDGLIFDADNIPARVAATGLATIGAAPQPKQPATVTLAHGAAPSLCIGVAESTYVTTGFEYFSGTWFIRIRNPNLNGGNPSTRYNEVPDMVGQWVTPFLFEGDDSQGTVQSCGWRISWDGTNISLHNYSGNGIRVRWAALEF